MFAVVFCEDQTILNDVWPKSTTYMYKCVMIIINFKN